MIPKIIHYCWYGGKKKPKIVQKCIESWKENLPDYEIMCWDESNSIFDNDFVKSAYNEKKWSFVADYFRFQKLYEHGGVYLDTDVLILKSLNKLLEYNCFLGYEEQGVIGTAVIGAIPLHQFIKNCKEIYEDGPLTPDGNYKKITSPKIITKCYSEYKTKHDVKILPKNQFYPLSTKNKYDKDYKKYLTDESYGIHLWEASWAEIPAYRLIRQKQYYKSALMIWFEITKKNQLSWKYLRKLTSSFKQSLN